MVHRSWILVAALTWGCGDSAGSDASTTGTSAGDDGDGDATPATSQPSGTSTDDGGPNPGDSTGTIAMDLPPPAIDSCPARAELALCIPPSRDEPAMCLCSRQNLGPGVPVAGDLDRDGLDDLLVRSERAGTSAYRSTGAALERFEAIAWPRGVDASTVVLQYVPALGVVAYSSRADDELVFGVYDLESGASSPSTIVLPLNGDEFPGWWFADHDGDDALDLLVTILEPVGLDDRRLSVTLYPDAASAPLGTELFSQLTMLAIDSPQYEWMIDDIDSDGFDDLWFQAFEPGFPQILWGSPQGLAFPGQAIDPAPVHATFDPSGDGARELIGYGWGFAGFVVTEQTRARSFAAATVVPSDPTIEIAGNAVVPVARGDRTLALALRSSNVIPIPPTWHDSAMGVTAIDSPQDIASMRTALFEGVKIQLFGTLDLDGDGADEVLATHALPWGEPTIHIFDVVDD